MSTTHTEVSTTHTDTASQLGGHRGDKWEGNPPCSHRPGLCQPTPEGGKQGGQHLGSTTGAPATTPASHGSRCHQGTAIPCQPMAWTPPPARCDHLGCWLLPPRLEEPGHGVRGGCPVP